MKSWPATELGKLPRRAAQKQNVPSQPSELTNNEEYLRGVGVFLNVPYDQHFSDLFLAYIAGLAVLGLSPRTVGGERRLGRTFDLIERCRYSVHDLSRVELNARPPATPRFNMPFELGLAVAWQRVQPHEHTCHVFESRTRRIEKSLSDLGGTDVHIHRGLPAGVFAGLTNAFVRLRSHRAWTK
jgi:hypothetical protein